MANLWSEAIMIHIAFMHGKYLDLILSGEKTIESRLLLTNRTHPAFSCEPGHLIVFKRSGGNIEAQAAVRNVHRFYDLNPDAVDSIRQDYNDRIKADDSFWQKKQNSKQAVLIELEDVVKIYIDARGLNLPFNQRLTGWAVLESEESLLTTKHCGVNHENS